MLIQSFIRAFGDDIGDFTSDIVYLIIEAIMSTKDIAAKRVSSINILAELYELSVPEAELHFAGFLACLDFSKL